MSYQIRYLVDSNNQSTISFISNYEMALLLTNYINTSISVEGTAGDEVTFESPIPGSVVDPEDENAIVPLQSLTGKQVGITTINDIDYKIVELELTSGGI